MSSPPTQQMTPQPTLRWSIPRYQLFAFSIFVSLCVLPLLVAGLTQSMSRRESPKRATETLARLSDEVSVEARGRGNPLINLSDGHQLLTSYVGPEDLSAALEQNRAEPLSLASADFDEDGVPDLVSGYGYNGQGIVTLLRGNGDAIYPNAPEAKQRRATNAFTDAPFLSPARVFESPVPADFIGAGDFDGDGHWDVVTGCQTGDALHFLAGDGHGGFSSSQNIGLSGRLTALVSGEINRADGLNDVIVGVTSQDASWVLVFESPNGALKAAPEKLSMPGVVASLTLAQLDDELESDLAIASGSEVVLLHGRDRKLSLDSGHRENVLPARIETRSMGVEIRSLTTGRFRAPHSNALGLLTAGGALIMLSPARTTGKQPATGSLSTWATHVVASDMSLKASQLVPSNVSSGPGDDLLMYGNTSKALQLLVSDEDEESNRQAVSLAPSAALVALLPLQLNPDGLTDLVALQRGQNSPTVIKTATLQMFVVNSTADTNDGACNTTPNCTLREAINAANQNPGADSITFNIAGTAPFTINLQSALPETASETVTIDGTTQPGFPGTPIIELNATNVPGAILNIHGPNSRVRGLVINRFAVSGINVLHDGAGSIIEGNYFGTNVAGVATFPVSHFTSVFLVGTANCLVGGTTAAARNIVAGAGIFSISVSENNGTPSTGNLVQGNYVGTNAAGNAVLGAGDVHIDRSNNNTIGGTVAGARNVIAPGQDNGWGVFIRSGADNLVQGNLIGTDVTGTVALGVKNGVVVNDESHTGRGGNLIGGTVVSARNVIAQPNFKCVWLFEGTSGNLVQGNYIGTDITGTKAFGARFEGVDIASANNNTIGGATAGARNLISGNKGPGVLFRGNAQFNQVLGNYVGTDAAGNAGLPNDQGVFVENSDDNVIGSTTAGAGNLISGNTRAGMAIYGGPYGDNSTFNGSKRNRIAGNLIGTNAAGTVALANGEDGVQITINGGSAENTIGGPTTASRNIISGNQRNGVAIGIRISRNSETGVQLAGTGGVGVTVQNNYIGTDVSGNNCIGNTLDGLFVDADSFENTFRDNLITCNGRNGVFIPQNANPGVRIFIDSNSVFSNVAQGIDLGLAGITANDSLDTDGGANLQQNFPVLTSFGSVAPTDDSPNKPIDPGKEAIIVNATLNSTPNTAFTVHWYFSSDAQCTTNQQASRPLATGKVPGVTTDNNGNAAFNFPFDFPAAITNGIVNCTATDPQGNTSEFSACLVINAAGPTPTPTPTPITVQFTSGTANVSETVDATTKVDLTVTRSGDTSATATVNYATSDGTASERSDYLATLGTVLFAAGETSKTISVFIVDDRFGESAETFNVTLSNPAGSALGTPLAVTVTINSNESVNGSNPVRDPNFSSDFFVRMQYLDFFNRAADSGGLNFWKNQIDECEARPAAERQPCRELRRVNVSAAFFVSIEFQETGYLVYKAYQAAYNSGEFLKLRDFLPDLQEIGRGVVIGQPGADAQLEANKQKFFLDFVQRSKFTEAGNYPNTLTAALFVDKLNANTFDPRNTGSGGSLTQSQRDQMVAQLSVSPTSPTLRAQALRSVSENGLFSTRQFNKAFVLMQYFGYLRRNPNDPPEFGLDFGGYNFWLGKLNQFNGNYIAAEMVKAFITSGEYEQRFGP